MNDEFDDNLKKRIGEVFDNYEDHGADEGWMLLREKFPAPAKHRGVARLWWTAAAAVLLLFVGVGLWLNYQPQDTPLKVAQNHSKTGEKPVPAKPDTSIETTNTTQQSVEAAAKLGTDSYPGTTFTPQAPTLVSQPRIVIKKAKPDGTNVEKPTIIAATKSANPADAVANNSPTAADTKKQPEDPAFANTPKPEKAADNVNKSVIVRQEPAKGTIMSMLEKDSQANNGQQNDNNKMVHFGVYAATYVNYAKGSDNRVNVGAGISSDFRLSKNLKLSTGISIAQNSFNYGGINDGLPQAAVQDAAAFTATAATGEEKLFSGLLISPTLQNYSAQLVGLDIPLNLKYEFNPGKSDTYITAGFSSGTFLNESYTYQYGYNSNVNASAVKAPENEKITEGFGNFYFARTLNFAFGVGYPLGKNNRLVIEPFVKYPLDGLGAQQIRFGAGGINLKLNFQTKK